MNLKQDMPIKTSIETEEVRYKTAKSIREYQETIEIYKTPNQISGLRSNSINIKIKIRIKIQRKKKFQINRKKTFAKKQKTFGNTRQRSK